MSSVVVWMLLSLGSTGSVTPIGYFATQQSCEQAMERIGVSLSHTANMACVKATLVSA